MRQPIGRTSFGDHCPGHELRHGCVGHPIRHGADNVDRTRHRLGLVALRQQRGHAVGGEVSRGLTHLLKDSVQLFRVGARHLLGEAAQQVQEGGRLGLDPARRRGRFELRHQLQQLRGSPMIPSKRPQRRVVELQQRPGKRGGDDLIDGGGIPLLLPQDLRIVDFDDVEAGAAGSGPEPRDAAVARAPPPVFAPAAAAVCARIPRRRRR